MEKGIVLGKRDDLISGGLIRSNGGCAAVKAMRRAESPLCYWANRDLGLSMAELSRRMDLSAMAFSYAARREGKIAKESHFSLE